MCRGKKKTDGRRPSVRTIREVFVKEQPVIGASGIGRWVAVSLQGQSTKLVSLVGFDLIGDIGGML